MLTFNLHTRECARVYRENKNETTLLTFGGGEYAQVILYQ